MVEATGNATARIYDSAKSYAATHGGSWDADSFSKQCGAKACSGPGNPVDELFEGVTDDRDRPGRPLKSGAV